MRKLSLNLDAPSAWPESVLRAAAAELGKRAVLVQRSQNGGRPANPKPCPKCGKLFSGRAMRAHRQHCPG